MGGEQVDQKVFWNMPVLLQFGPACVGKVHFYLPKGTHIVDWGLLQPYEGNLPSSRAGFCC